MADEARWWRRLVARALDLLYPPLCELCGCGLRDNRWLCGQCAAGLPRVREPFCEVCGEPFAGAISGAFTCPNCRGRRWAFDFARAALDGGSPTARGLVHALKYQRRIYLAGELALLMGETFNDPRLARARAEGWVLVPIPLHRKRLRHRHFNQAAELARQLGRQLGMPVVPALRRIRATGSQTRLGRARRLANLRGAFALRRAACSLAGRPVILVDDVLTTGATSHECARLLKRYAAVPRVAVVTLLRS